MIAIKFMNLSGGTRGRFTCQGTINDVRGDLT